MGEYRGLRKEEIEELERQDCRAEEWSRVQVKEGFEPRYLRSVRFSGDISLGLFNRSLSFCGGIKRHAGIFNAALHNCRIGDNAYISGIDQYIANYDIGEQAVIDRVTMLVTEGESSFGNGIEAAVINENGGREIPIFDGLSSHLAYTLALYRHRPGLIAALKGMIREYTARRTSRRGVVGAGARVSYCGIIKNVAVGPWAVIEGASRLENGTVNSKKKAPSFVGIGVIAKDFICATDSRLDESVLLERCFIGQGAILARQYSAENSVFFANSGGYHGEACSIFAGPYTVTHHKSTLLIAGMFSFMNAGSGSNQSNHMYKLGPVHQGILERGAKTTSDSYILFPAKVGAFTLVMGRHYSNSDTSELPFSYLIEEDNESVLVPGVNIRSVGTVRDSKKWPKRDQRHDPNMTDYIIFNLLSPFTVQKMYQGREILKKVRRAAGHSSMNYYYNGVRIKRHSLEKGLRFYQLGIDRFLGNIVVSRLRHNAFHSLKELRRLFQVTVTAGRARWVDAAGLIVPEEVLDSLLDDIEAGRLGDVEEVQQAFKRMYQDYPDYELAWVDAMVQEDFGKPLGGFQREDFYRLLDNWLAAVETLDRQRTEDAEKEFSYTARVGFGVGGKGGEDSDSDFRAVRGDMNNNDFIVTMTERLQGKRRSVEALKERIEGLPED